MPDKDGKIDWKKRLEAVRQGQPKEPSQPDITLPEPPVKKLFSIEEVLHRQAEPEPGKVLKINPRVHQAKPTVASTEPLAPLPPPQTERVERLEQQVSGLKVRVTMSLSLIFLLSLGFAVMMIKGTTVRGSIRADALAIKDDKGVSRVWIGDRNNQGRLELRDQAVRRGVSLGPDVAGSPRLIFYNKGQKELTEIVPLPEGQSGLKLLTRAGEIVATISAPTPSTPSIPEPQALAPLPAHRPQPALVAPEASKAEQKTEIRPTWAAKAFESECFVANPGGKAYHLPSCSWVKHTPGDKLVKFSSAAEASKAGYHPCRHCRPDHKD